MLSLKGNLGKPWSSDDKRIQSLPKKGRELWVRVANAYIEEHGDSEDNAVSAIRIAWSAVRNAGYKKGEGDQKHKWAEPTAEGLASFTKALHPFGAVPVTFCKAETKNGKRYVTVKASGMKVDRQDERMAQSAIDDMTEACKAGDVELLDNHFSSFEMGKSTDATTNEAGEMFVEFELNDNHPNNDQLYAECEQGVCKRQASVGGNVTKARYEYDDIRGKAVKVLEHVKLDHVAVTRSGHSAYPDAEFVGAICKQVHLQELNLEGGETMNKEQILKALEALGIDSEAFSKSLFKITADMLDPETFALKAEFRDKLAKSDVKLVPEEKTRVAKSLASILGALGVPVVFNKGESTTVAETPEMSAVSKALFEAATEIRKGLDGETTEEKAAVAKLDEALKGYSKAEEEKGKKPKASGSGSAAENDGNGSADAAKSLIEAMKKDIDARLVKANEAFETLKKDTHTTKAELTKSMLEVVELKKELAKVSALPATPRPGAAAKVVKTTESTSGAPGEDLNKSTVGDPLVYMSKLQTEVDRLAKQRNAGGRGWTAELQKEAEIKAAILKDCISIGPGAAMEKHGIKDDSAA